MVSQRYHLPVSNRADSLLELVQCLGRLMRAESRSRPGTGELHPVHLQALLYLKQANRYSNTPQALTEYLGSTKGTVSQSLLLLYRKGWVNRYADAEDGRVVRLGLSAKGERLLARAGMAPVWQRALQGIQAGDVETALRVLQQALLNLQRERSQKSFGVCHTCRHFRREGGQQFRCGLTGESLEPAEILKICREHAWPQPRETNSEVS